MVLGLWGSVGVEAIPLSGLTSPDSTVVMSENGSVGAGTAGAGTVDRQAATRKDKGLGHLEVAPRCEFPMCAFFDAFPEQEGPHLFLAPPPPPPPAQKNPANHGVPKTYKPIHGWQFPT